MENIIIELEADRDTIEDLNFQLEEVSAIIDSHKHEIIEVHKEMTLSSLSSQHIISR